MDTETSALRATAHPLRLRILSLLTGTAMSAAEVARALDISHANASYHLRRLAEASLLVEAGQESIRGGVAKRYRHPWDDSHLSSASTFDLLGHVDAMAEELVRRAARRRPGERSVFTDAEMWVTPEVWRQVLDHVAEASEVIHREARPPHEPGTLPVNLSVAAFQMLTGDGRDDDRGSASRPAHPS